MRMAILSDNISQFWSKLGQSKEQNKLQFMALAKDIGLEISAEELQAASGLTDELTDDQLEAVAGGGDRNLWNNGQKSASASDLPYISYPFIIEIYLNKKMKLYF